MSGKPLRIGSGRPLNMRTSGKPLKNWERKAAKPLNVSPRAHPPYPNARRGVSRRVGRRCV